MESLLPWQRLMGALIARAALETWHKAILEDTFKNAPSSRRLTFPSSPPPALLSSLPSYGLLLALLPVPHQDVSLCPLREATATLRALLSDSPGNQEAAVKAQVISAMVHVSGQHVSL